MDDGEAGRMRGGGAVKTVFQGHGVSRWQTDFSDGGLVKVGERFGAGDVVGANG